jgi:hypothetical protein
MAKGKESRNGHVIFPWVKKYVAYFKSAKREKAPAGYHQKIGSMMLFSPPLEDKLAKKKPEPSDSRPGSDERIKVLRGRLANGKSLFAEGDRKFPASLRPENQRKYNLATGARLPPPASS